MLNSTFNLFLEDSLNNLKVEGFYNEIEVLDGANECLIKINGKEFINLSSNNYLGFTTHKTIVQKVLKQLKNMELDQDLLEV